MFDAENSTEQPIYVCAPKLADGAECSFEGSDASCESGFCHDLKCGKPVAPVCE